MMRKITISIHLDDDEVAVLEREVIRINKVSEDNGNAPNWTIEKELRDACRCRIYDLRKREKQELVQKNSTRTD